MFPPQFPKINCFRFSYPLKVTVLGCLPNTQKVTAGLVAAIESECTALYKAHSQDIYLCFVACHCRVILNDTYHS